MPPAKRSKAEPSTPDLPDLQTASAAFAPALALSQERVLQTLKNLGSDPPQVLILEGGSEQERFATALWYTARLNCQAANAPCLECPTCLQIGGMIFHDIHILDGRLGSIKIAEVRELRKIFAEAPRSIGTRVIVLAEAQALGIAAANALLKSLEEPRKNLCFLLLAPQREQLLPTLVSRGWVLALPWPTADDAQINAELLEWQQELATFITSGTGWFSKTSAKGAATVPIARDLVLAIQRALLSTVHPKTNTAPLAACFTHFPPAAILYVSHVLQQAELSLGYSVNPALVLDWMATRLHTAARNVQQRRAKM